MTRDALLIARPFSKGNMTGAEAPATVPNAGADTNVVTVPPGLYDVEVQFGAPGGTAVPTSFTAQVKERGYLLGTSASQASVTTDGASWTNLDDDRQKTLTFNAGPPANYPSRYFLRGVRINKWNNGERNAGIALSFTGGTAPTLANTQVTFHPAGRTAQWNGRP